MRTRIIGVGNPDRGDDAAGLLVARRLAGMGADAVEFTGEALSLIDQWEGFDQVILVDTTVSGAPPGEILHWDAVSQRLPKNSFCCSTHVFGVAEAVELARIFERLPPRLEIYGIEGSSFESGAEPSGPIQAAVAELADTIYHEIAA